MNKQKVREFIYDFWQEAKNKDDLHDKSVPEDWSERIENEFKRGHDTNAWFFGTCELCDYNVIYTQLSDGLERFYCYCSNKNCQHHDGEHTNDIEEPSWVVTD